MEIAERNAPASAIALSRRKRLPPSLDALIRAEQVRLLHGTPFVWVFNLVIALLASSLLWPVYPPSVVYAWIGLLAIIIAIRLVVWFQYTRRTPGEGDDRRWALIFSLGTFATGCVWGLLSTTVFATSQPAYYVFVAFVLGGMTAGAALRDSAYPPAFYAFTIPAITPTIIALLVTGAPLSNEMAFMLMAFTAVLMLVARANAERIADNIRLHAEQDMLIDDLEQMSTDLKQRIIEREETAAALHESNERFRSIGESAQDAIITVDADGLVAYWNPAAEHIFGYRAAEIAGRRIHTLLVPERLRKEADNGFAKFAQTGHGPVIGTTGRFTALHKDGHEFPLELSISAMQIGGTWQALGIARDITERKAAEAALRDSEAALREAQRLAHIGSWVWDLKHDKVTWSEQLYRIMHLDPALPPPRARDIPPSLAGKGTAHLQTLMTTCATTGAPFAADLELQRVSGGIVWISVYGEAVRDDDGTIVAVRGTVQDITDRKHAEAALRQSEAALRSAQRLAHIGSWVRQSNPETLTWSEEMYHIFRLPPDAEPLRLDELTGLTDTDSGEELRSNLISCVRDGIPFTMDIRARRTDDTPMWISVQCEATHDDNSVITAVRGTVQDITERKLAEAALQESEAALRDAQHLAHVGSWSWQPGPRIATWSEEMYRIFRLDPRKGAPDFARLETLLGSDGLKRMREASAACQAEGTPFMLDIAAQRGDGSPIWVSMHGEALYGPDGRVARVRGTVQDITERKTAEQNIAELHRQMTQNVERLQRHDEQMRAIARMSDLLQACHTRSEAYPIIASTARTLFPNADGALALVSPGTHQLETVTQWGDRRSMTKTFSFDDCWALRTGRRYDVTGSGKGPPCRHFNTVPTGPSVCLPLTAQGGTSGLLHMDCPPGSPIDDDKQNLMTSFADVIKLSLANLRMREILSEQALRDQLTALFNRHYLAETLPREIQRAKRDKVALSLVMLDIDHFKQFNDRFGHDAGDTVLRAVGELLNHAMRGGDIACRYGGEEFLLVLPECTANNARDLLEKIRGEIRTMSLVLHDTPLPPVTVSAGVAEWAGELASAEALIAAADRALYAAKTNGRDRIELFAPGMRPGKRLERA